VIHAPEKKKKSKIVEYLEAIVTAFILALIIRAYVVQAYKIPSGSMIPTLVIGDHILVNKFIYGTNIPFTHEEILVFDDPERGDIIVFEYPRNPERDFIKRIIGVGGDKIEIKDKKIFINGEPMDDPWGSFTDPTIRKQRDNFGPIVVPEGKYFVMGDNRDNSHDSRFWGFVSRDQIKGEAFIIYFSWNSKGELFDKIRFRRIGMLLI
jgi:signal peptidase I